MSENSFTANLMIRKNFIVFRMCLCDTLFTGTQSSVSCFSLRKCKLYGNLENNGNWNNWSYVSVLAISFH